MWAFVLGIQSSIGNGCQNFLRLSFAFYDLPQIAEGMDRLAELFLTSLDAQSLN